MSVGRLLKKLRKDAGLSQQEVAVKLGMARATYASLEVDRREPDLGELKAISQFYEISMMELVAEEGDDWPGVVSEPKAHYGSEKRPNVAPQSPRHDKSAVDIAKVRQILLYVAEQIGAKPTVGESVLHKLLYFIDFGYHEKYGQTVTGLTYVHSRFGPAPPRIVSDLVKQMEADGELEIVATKHFNNTQKKYLPLIRADLQGLSAREYLHINETIARLGDETSEQLRALYVKSKTLPR